MMMDEWDQKSLTSQIRRRARQANLKASFKTIDGNRMWLFSNEDGPLHEKRIAQAKAEDFLFDYLPEKMQQKIRDNRAFFKNEFLKRPNPLQAGALFGLNGMFSITRESLDILYRGLAKKYHPDLNGGNGNGMVHLTTCRDALITSGICRDIPAGYDEYKSLGREK